MTSALGKGLAICTPAALDHRRSPPNSAEGSTDFQRLLPEMLPGKSQLVLAILQSPDLLGSQDFWEPDL